MSSEQGIETRFLVQPGLDNPILLFLCKLELKFEHTDIKLKVHAILIMQFYLFRLVHNQVTQV